MSKLFYLKGMSNRSSALIGQTVNRMLFRRSTLFAVFFLLIPPGISVYTLIDTPDNFEWMDMFSNMGLFIYLQILILLYTLIFGTSLVNEDIDNRTVTYLINRGMKRWEVVVYRYTGFIITLSVLFFFSIGINYVLLSFHGSFEGMISHLDFLAAMLGITIISIIVYGSLFIMVGISFRKPLMIGLLFAFIWEIFIANIPGNIKSITIIYYLRSLFHHWIPISASGDLTGMTALTTAFILLFLFTSLFLALGIFIFSRKDLH
jgi:ABC-2 type transport system permease protein